MNLLQTFEYLFHVDRIAQCSFRISNNLWIFQNLTKFGLFEKTGLTFKNAKPNKNNQVGLF